MESGILTSSLVLPPHAVVLHLSVALLYWHLHLCPGSV